MPINIYEQNSSERLAWLCNDIWDLPDQISKLESWITANVDSLPKSDYVIDIGFDIRPNATGGGAVISSDIMRLMADKGFNLYLSEYPNQLND